MCFFPKILWFFWTLPVLLQRWFSTCLVCVHTLTPRENRVRNIFLKIGKIQYLMNTLYYTQWHPKKSLHLGILSGAKTIDLVWEGVKEWVNKNTRMSDWHLIISVSRSFHFFPFWLFLLPKSQIWSFLVLFNSKPRGWA